MYLHVYIYIYISHLLKKCPMLSNPAFDAEIPVLRPPSETPPYPLHLDPKETRREKVEEGNSRGTPCDYVLKHMLYIYVYIDMYI